MKAHPARGRLRPGQAACAPPADVGALIAFAFTADTVGTTAGAASAGQKRSHRELLPLRPVARHPGRIPPAEPSTEARGHSPGKYRPASAA
jgi:hypothetical protein